MVIFKFAVTFRFIEYRTWNIAKWINFYFFLTKFHILICSYSSPNLKFQRQRQYYENGRYSHWIFLPVSEGRKVFRAFLRCEYSEENILFWLACEELKREKCPEMIEEKARVIYEDYVSILSPREVSWYKCGYV